MDIPRHDRWLAGIVAGLAGYSFSLLLGLASGVAAARFLGANTVGELSAVQTLPGLILFLPTLGLSHSVVYYTAQRRTSARTFVGTSVALGLALAVPAALLTAGMQHVILGHKPAHVRLAGELFGLFIPLTILASMPWGSFQGAGRFKIFNILRLLPQITYTAVILGAVFSSYHTTLEISIAQLMAIALICVPAVWYWLVQEFRPGSPWFSARLLRPLLAYGIPSMAAFVPNALNQQVDKVFLAALVPTRDLGFYSVGVSWAVAQCALMWAVAAVLLPQLAGSPGEDQNQIFSTTLRRAAVAALVLGTAQYFATPVVIPLAFGKSFTQAVGPAQVLVLAATLTSMTLVASDGFRGLGRPRVPLVAECLGLMLTVPGLLVAVPALGIVGAAWVSLASYALTFSFLMTVYQTKGPGDTGDWWSATVSDGRSLGRFLIRKRYAS